MAAAALEMAGFSLKMNASNWQWHQLTDYQSFRWNVGNTPFADLRVIAISWTLYFSTIIALLSYMRNREPFKLKLLTAGHNMFLCLISLVMFVAGVVGTYNRATTRGISEIFCTTDKSSMQGLLSYTLYLYYLSKFVELFDTVILILKKKPLIFLHWYHHAIVILMVWSWLEYDVVFASQGMIANTLIHVFMYYYYGVSSLGIKKYITSGQIVQFTISFVLSIPYLYYHFEKGCSGWGAFVFSMSVNASFLLLFIDFYRRTYTAKDETPAAKNKIGAAKKQK
eukprot:jgi/Hompol1/1086/HPOL_002639-RA